MAQLGRDFVSHLSAFSADFEFRGKNYKTIWTKVRGPVAERRNYKQDWILCDMYLDDDPLALVNCEESVEVGSDPWTAALEANTAFDAFFGDIVRIGELGMFRFEEDYKPDMPYYMVQEQLFRFIQQLERKPEYHANDVWHEMFMEVYKQYEFYRETRLRESIFFYHWSRDCDLCESEGIEVFDDWYDAAEWIKGFGDNAEGPQSLEKVSYEQWRVFNPSPVRDRVAEMENY
jgi:hypothetical protein